MLSARHLFRLHQVKVITTTRPTLVVRASASPGPQEAYEGMQKVSGKARGGRLKKSKEGFPVTQEGTRQFSSSSPTTPPPSSERDQAPEEKMVYPADLDAKRFKLDPSVARWQGFSTRWSSGLTTNTSSSSSSASAGVSALQQAVSRLLDAASSNTSASSTGGVDPQAAAYWVLHISRFSFFASQAAAGLAAHHAYETVVGGRSSSGGGNGNRPAPEDSTPLTRIMANGVGELANRLNEAVGTWEQDYAWIAGGAYKMPWDMVTPNRQFNPLYMLNRTNTFINESVATLRRRTRNSPDPVWLNGGMYPSYYAQGFHYQTDGWLSSRSADIYDHSTETLFVGRQDAMQRSALVPISEFIASSEMPVSQMKLLEVGAGTGRFHTFLRDNYPELPTACTDLSPFYLQQARKNMKAWKRARQPNKWLGGVDDTGVMEYIQTQAETLDVPDASMDIVLSVYLFHELPEESRVQAVQEMYRVLKPGGLAVFCDSVQLGDRPEWNHSMGNFGNFQEPNYRSYIATDIGGLFAQQGFIPGTKYVSSATKTLSFRKPGQTVDPAA